MIREGSNIPRVSAGSFPHCSSVCSNLHVAINSHKERAQKYAQAMERLLASENGRDLDRGMTHFERAVGLAGGGVNVTVDNRRQTAILNQPTSFEEVMDRVRAKLVAERREQGLIAAIENCR